jgi:hypothetical protein
VPGWASLVRLRARISVRDGSRTATRHAGEPYARQDRNDWAAAEAEFAAGRPVRVPLLDGQSARGLRVAISLTATSRDLSGETL